ncbi:MAG: response regulator [Lachnospiraceae bacterium]|nr:response regulator [Lachnospiraceae bacterium]MBQ1720846.1 response regulator [Lachnospiraceae bacterium]MBQ2532910.1 response regulator [Lachnospiraceae bacterium]MBQ2579666.1 response regulator [Lachnospiraceae bacterium]MBQ5385512.1 response regulator [Lachnospiraceae bacterium]
MMSDDLDLGMDLNLDDLDLDLDLDFDLDDLDLGMDDLRSRVMVIDDDAGTLRNIKSILDGVYVVSVANSGKKALDLLAIEKPDVILLDYEMPMMNGPETMQKIRMKPGFKDTPIIFLTGVNDRSQIAAALALRPAGYLLKPVNQNKLLMTILDALNGGA